MDLDRIFTDVMKTTKLQYRDYQKRIILKSLDHFCNKRTKSVLIESPCGAGKTPCLLVIAKCLQTIYPGWRIGWTTLRKKLLTQASEENVSKGILANIMFFSMFDKNPPVPLDMLIVDECHHDSTSSMSHIHNVTRPKMILGGTGTNFRSDRVKLCFSTIIKDGGIGRLIAEGYLAPYHHYTIPEWSVESVCEFYLGFREVWGKSIIYFHRLVQCQEAVDKLTNCGIRAVAVLGNKEADRLTDAFAAGEYDVLVNCNMLVEGYNDPVLNTVFCRPGCKSSTIQQAGRVFRKHPDLPYKNVVQSEKTKWPFMKTALPKMQWLWTEGEWRSLTPDENIIHAVYNSLKAISLSNAQMPTFIEEKRKLRGRRRGRNRAGFF